MTSSFLHQVKARYNYYEYSSFIFMNNSISIKLNLFKFTADREGKGSHFCLTLDKITSRLIVQ